MRRAARLVLLAVPAALAAVTASQAGAVAPKVPGVSNPAQARVDYIIKCQGCHRPDGSGDNHSNPPMNGFVAKFLGVPGGREFLVRVPGVATAALDDKRLTDLVNWTLYRFDAADVPPDFRPYTVEEVARLRMQPLRLERASLRADLVAKMDRRGTN
ncbi:MAG: cytochrome C [Sphingomonadales bacterium]|nr:cytochrome C [Sphingomonadales bacterium]MDE2568811.1 cytochrome C [Sphingomonadales bacterium]